MMYYHRSCFRCWRFWIILILIIVTVYHWTITYKNLGTNKKQSSTTKSMSIPLKRQNKNVNVNKRKSKSTTNDSISRLLNGLKAMAPNIVDQQTVKRILLVTTFRTGSTFLGSLLQESDSLTYYHYEPLHFLSFDSHVKRHQIPEAHTAIKHLFQCDMKDVFYRIRNSRNRIGVIYITENQLLTKVCRSKNGRSTLCMQWPIWQETCQRSRVQLMKLTRLDLKDALTVQLPNSTKIVYLQRDPRGIYSSRKRRPWCSKKRCQNIDTLCKERESDIATLKNLPNRNQVIVLRFEDFAEDPMKEGEKLFKALDLEFSENVKRYIESHTQMPANASENLNKVRNSKEVAVSWKKYLTTDEINEVQEKCANVFKEAGYELV